MGMTNIDQLIGKVAEQNGIRLDKDDPAFALVTLSQIVLQETANGLHAQIRSTVDEFAESVKRLDVRAGGIIAREVTLAAAGIRRELQQDIASAGLQARELVRRVEAGHRRPAIARWVSIGILFGALLLLCGFFLGRLSYNCV